ncbi:MAG: gas vesicle protein K [Anaerolineales bacterium]|nr:gas vesicle protein K [Anaerolineales bacterium]
MLDIDEGNLKQGVLGLVIALVEIIQDALKTQAFKRMESGRLNEAEIDRLGEALMDLDVALTQIKEEHGVAEAVKNVRDGLDDIVDEVLDKMINPERWREELETSTVRA